MQTVGLFCNVVFVMRFAETCCKLRSLTWCCNCVAVALSHVLSASCVSNGCFMGLNVRSKNMLM